MIFTEMKEICTKMKETQKEMQAMRKVLQEVMNLLRNNLRCDGNEKQSVEPPREHLRVE